MSAAPYPGTQTVLRAVTLLKAFTDARPEWGLSDLARMVGLNKTTTYRLLTALAGEGMITRNPATETYRLGPEAIALGGRALRSNSLREASRAALESLAEATGESVTLEVLAEGEVLILDEVQGRHLVGTTLSIGTRWPAHATSTGKIILAFLADEERNAVLPRRLARPTGKTIGDRETLTTELRRARERGYATQTGELEDDYAAVGAPVFNHDGKVVAAVSVGAPSIRLNAARMREVSPLVMQTAAQISRSLGYRP